MGAIALALSLGEPVDDAPKWRRYAGGYCMTPSKPGCFRAILNRAKVLSAPRIAEVLVLAKPGIRVAPAPENNAYIGIIVAHADTYFEVDAALTWARHELHVVIE